MKQPSPSVSAAVAVVLAILFVVALFLWQGRTGFNLGDEGFLWYGVQRILEGEVPIRDFMAYDPGRYYWSAALLRLAGNDGIVALRIAVAIVHALGLAIALLLVLRNSRKLDWSLLLLAAVTLSIWMFPRHKLFDISLSIILVGTLTLLVARPSALRWFLSGLVVGLAAVFGRNHGVYGATASLAIFAWLYLRRDEEDVLPAPFKALAIWVCGIAVGYLPVIAMATTIPGFAAAFWDSIRFLFEIKNTNLPLPVPWPWLVPPDRLPTIEGVRAAISGLFFVSILAFGTLGAVWLFWARWKRRAVPPALVAAILLALPYAHVAYSRADNGHLAQGIFPFLIGVLTLIARMRPPIKWPIALALSAISVVAIVHEHPGWYCQTSGQCAAANVAGDDLLVTTATAGELALLDELSGKYAPEGQPFVATPLWPGAYAAAKRRSPMWEIYALFPRSAEFQQAEIERIAAARPRFVLVIDVALDGRDDLRFRNTHPLIDRYIRDNFEPVADYAATPIFQIYRSKEPAE